MAFHSGPNTKRGEFTGDGQELVRMKRRMLKRIQRLGKKNPKRARALLRRLRSAGGNQPGGTDVSPTGRRRRSDRAGAFVNAARIERSGVATRQFGDFLR